MALAGKDIWEFTATNVGRFFGQLVGRGLTYSTRRKQQSNITTFLDSPRVRHARHAHEIWQRGSVAIPTVLDELNRHTPRRYEREDAPPPRPGAHPPDGRVLPGVPGCP